MKALALANTVIILFNKNLLFHEGVGLRNVPINECKVAEIPVRSRLNRAILGLLRRLTTTHYQCLIMASSAYQFNDTVGQSALQSVLEVEML